MHLVLNELSAYEFYIKIQLYFAEDPSQNRWPMPAFIIHEKLMSLGLTGRTEIFLKSGLVICSYLSKADG